jgi:hypothetical protein
MSTRSELNSIKYALKVLTRVQTREDKRHIMDAHLNSEMREYLEEAIELLERIDEYDPTPVHTPGTITAKKYDDYLFGDCEAEDLK